MGWAVSYTLVHKRSLEEGLSGQKGVSRLSVPALSVWPLGTSSSSPRHCVHLAYRAPLSPFILDDEIIQY